MPSSAEITVRNSTKLCRMFVSDLNLKTVVQTLKFPRRKTRGPKRSIFECFPMASQFKRENLRSETRCRQTQKFINCETSFKSTAKNRTRTAFMARGTRRCHQTTAAQRCYFLPRCMECRRGLAMRILSVRLSVCLSNACIVTKWKKNMFTFLYHTKDHLS